MEDYDISWKDHGRETFSIIEKFRSQNEYADMMILCENETLQGHRVVLAACSSYFDRILSAIPKDRRSICTPLVVLQDTRLELLKLALNFIYTGEASVPSEKLDDFMTLANKLEVHGLRVDLSADSVAQDSAPAAPPAKSTPTPAVNNNKAPGVKRPVAKKEPDPPPKRFKSVGTTPAPAPPPPQAVKVEEESEREKADNNDEWEEYVEETVESNDPLSEENYLTQAKDAARFFPSDMSTDHPLYRVDDIMWRGRCKHTARALYFCAICGKQYHRKEYAVAHGRSHTGEKPFACPYCGGSFSSRGTQLKHIRSHCPTARMQNN